MNYKATENTVLLRDFYQKAVFTLLVIGCEIKLGPKTLAKAIRSRAGSHNKPPQLAFVFQRPLLNRRQ